jgi:hypothetical protein
MSASGYLFRIFLALGVPAFACLHARARDRRRSCFGRYYRPYKALHFGEYAKEAYQLCVREQLREERPGEVRVCLPS